MYDFTQCPCSGDSLGKLLHAAILALLARGPLHGYLVVEGLSGLSILRGQRPDPAGVYRILRSLEDGGFVSGEWDLTRPGPARHIYSITPEGRGCLETWLETLLAYREGVNEIIEAAREAVLEGKERPGNPE